MTSWGTYPIPGRDLQRDHSARTFTRCMVTGMTGTFRWSSRLNTQLERGLGLRVVRAKNVLPPRGRARRPADPAIDRLVHEPVFVCSSVRSGSTLLRVILNSHSQIHAPHETHFRRLEVMPTTEPVRQAMAALDLNTRDLEHLLWDRLLHRELLRSGKKLIVEKTPSNVFIVDRLKIAWPAARFIFLLRHPYSVALSWHEGKPETRPMSRAIPYTLNFMQHVEQARERFGGLTVRYEDLTANPAEQTRRICDFLGVPWEEDMLEYGRQDHGGFVMGIGDWKEKIRSGAVQPGRPLPKPDEVPEKLRQMCKIWDY